MPLSYGFQGTPCLLSLSLVWVLEDGYVQPALCSPRSWRSSKGSAAQVSRKTLITQTITESKEQGWFGGSAEGDCGSGNISLVPTGSCTTQVPVNTGLCQCCPQHHSQAVWHRDAWGSRSGIKPGAFGIHLALQRIVSQSILMWILHRAHWPCGLIAVAPCWAKSARVLLDHS